MKHITALAKLALLMTVASLTHVGHAQSVSTASQQLELSAFGAATGTFTNMPLRLLRPSIEVRGTYPIYDGHVDSQKNILAGVRVEHAFGRLHPYADFLIGRGEIDFGQGGFVVGDIEYISTNTTIYSPGVGVDYSLGHGLAVKADLQYQHWDTPVVSSGTIHPAALSLGAVYHFNFNPRNHR